MNDTKFYVKLVLICIALIVFLEFCSNTHTESSWNDGVCPKCNVQYELRGVSRTAKYYACPECGKEVIRY